MKDIIIIFALIAVVAVIGFTYHQLCRLLLKIDNQIDEWRKEK